MPAVNGGPSRTVTRVFPARGALASYHREMHALIRNMWRASLMQVFLLRVQVYETLQILLQEGRTHARNGDTVIVFFVFVLLCPAVNFLVTSCE